MRSQQRSLCDHLLLLMRLNLLPLNSDFLYMQKALLGSLLALSTFVTLCRTYCYTIPLVQGEDDSPDGKSSFSLLIMLLLPGRQNLLAGEIF